MNTAVLSLLIGLCVVAYVAFWVLAISLIVDGDTWLHNAVGYLMATIAVAVLAGAAMWLVNTDNDQGPCLREETGYAWNASTRTMMPYTHCAERGTWVEQ